MKILQLIIKQTYFDQILSGEKKIETRELKPTTEKKYCVLDEDRAIVDLIQYDAIRFFVGYNKDRPTALVEVTGVELVELVDDNDEPMFYDWKGVKEQMIDIEYSLGKVLN